MERETYNAYTGTTSKFLHYHSSERQWMMMLSIGLPGAPNIFFEGWNELDQFPLPSGPFLNFLLLALFVFFSSYPAVQP